MSNASDAHYRDLHLKSARHAGEIPRPAVRDLRHLLDSALRSLSSADFDALIGELVTEPKGVALFTERKISAAAVRSRLQKGQTLVRSAGCRMGFLRQGQTTALFINGRRVPFAKPLRFTAPLLTGKRRILSTALVPHFKKPGFLSLLARLASAGIFYFEA